MRARTLWTVIIGTVGLSSTMARAQPVVERAPVRSELPLVIGVSPAWPWIYGKDVTLPLPAARVGVNLSPRLSLDVTGGGMKYGYSGRWTLVDLGARWFFADGETSPYLMARGGKYFDRADEGSDATSTYGVIGLGVEWACECGITSWGEAGPALVGYEHAEPTTWHAGAYFSLGVGYRFGARTFR